MDVSDASYYIFNEKGKIKVAKWGTPKKIIKKKGKKKRMEFMFYFYLKNYLQILTHSLTTFKGILSEALT